MQDPKKSPKIAIWAPSHNFVGLYLRKNGMYRQSEKKLLSSNISSTCPHNMVNCRPLAAEIVSGVWDQQISTGFTSCLRYCSDVAHRRPTKLSTMFYRLQGWYIFGGSCPWQNFARYKIHFTSKSCVGLFWQCYCMAVQQRPSAKLRRRTRNGITHTYTHTHGTFAEGATCIRQGGHHVGHRPTF